MALVQTETFYRLIDNQGTLELGASLQRSQIRDYGVNATDEELWSDYGRLWVDDGGDAPGSFYTKQQGMPIISEPNQRVERVDTWIAWAPADVRTSHEENIRFQRNAADKTNAELLFDPGFRSQIDEANAAAEERLKALGYVPETFEDLSAFDSTLNFGDVGAVASAQSLALQERALLIEDPTLTAQQVSDLEAAANAHEAIVIAGDNGVTVPAPPSFARTRVGVVAEEWGELIARREFTGGFWWINFELRVQRTLVPGQYWLAVYDHTASDTKGDPTGYLTTPQLTETEPDSGIWIADNLAVNLPKNTPDDVFKFTLCYQHLTNEQFDRQTLEAGDEYEFYRVRWAGDVENGAL